MTIISVISWPKALFVLCFWEQLLLVVKLQEEVQDNFLTGSCDVAKCPIDCDTVTREDGCTDCDCSNTSRCLKMVCPYGCFRFTKLDGCHTCSCIGATYSLVDDSRKTETFLQEGLRSGTRGACSMEDRRHVEDCLLDFSDFLKEARNKNPSIQNFIYPLYVFSQEQLEDLCALYEDAEVCVGVNMMSRCRYQHRSLAAMSTLLESACRTKRDAFFEHFDCISNLFESHGKVRECTRDVENSIKRAESNKLLSNREKNVQKCSALNAFEDCVKPTILQHCSAEHFAMFSSITQANLPYIAAECSLNGNSNGLIPLYDAGQFGADEQNLAVQRTVVSVLQQGHISVLSNSSNSSVSSPDETSPSSSSEQLTVEEQPEAEAENGTELAAAEPEYVNAEALLEGSEGEAQPLIEGDEQLLLNATESEALTSSEQLQIENRNETLSELEAANQEEQPEQEQEQEQPASEAVETQELTSSEETNSTERITIARPSSKPRKLTTKPVHKPAGIESPASKTLNQTASAERFGKVDNDQGELVFVNESALNSKDLLTNESSSATNVEEASSSELEELPLEVEQPVKQKQASARANGTTLAPVTIKELKPKFEDPKRNRQQLPKAGGIDQRGSSIGLTGQPRATTAVIKRRSLRPAVQAGNVTSGNAAEAETGLPDVDKILQQIGDKDVIEVAVGENGFPRKENNEVVFRQGVERCQAVPTRGICPEGTKPQSVLRYYRPKNLDDCAPYQYLYCSKELEHAEGPIKFEEECYDICFTEEEKQSGLLSRLNLKFHDGIRVKHAHSHN